MAVAPCEITSSGAWISMACVARALLVAAVFTPVAVARLANIRPSAKASAWAV